MVKHILNGILFIFLISCTQAEDIGGKSDRITEKERPLSIERPELPHLGAAPELKNEVWLNTTNPLRLSELEGNVILLEMWTFG